MANRIYTEDEKIAALAALDANGGNVKLTAAQLGLPRKTLTNWAVKIAAQEVTQETASSTTSGQPVGHLKTAVAITPDDVASARKSLSELLEEVVRKLIGGLLDDTRLRVADLKEVATAFGIAFDKRQLLQGSPTSITGQSLTDEQRADELRRLAERIRQRRVETPDAGRISAVPSAN
jgi:transposase-like protein